MPIIPEQHQHIFRSVAYMIEHKLLDMQMYLLAHRMPLRLVSVQYDANVTEEKLQQTEAALNRLYGLLEAFCKEYNIHPQHATEQKELLIKANFLWEDILSASVKNMQGYGKMDSSILEDYDRHITKMTEAVNALIDTIQY